jgi:hypothetical protein
MCGSNPHLAGSGTTPNILNSMNFWIVDNLSSFYDTASQTISQQHYNTILRMQKESSQKKFITVRYWEPTFTLFHIYMICGYGYSFRSSLPLSLNICMHKICIMCWVGINYWHTSVGKFLGLECQTQGLGPYDLELNSHFFSGTGTRIQPWN